MVKYKYIGDYEYTIGDTYNLDAVCVYVCVLAGAYALYYTYTLADVDYLYVLRIIISYCIKSKIGGGGGGLP